MRLLAALGILFASAERSIWAWRSQLGANGGNLEAHGDQLGVHESQLGPHRGPLGLR